MHHRCTSVCHATVIPDLAFLVVAIEYLRSNPWADRCLSNPHSFGHPIPTEVRTHHIPGKAILITGHDMADLEALLQQTEGKGINVYTHGEMLPGHSYPGLKKYAHLAGNWGGAWYKQKVEFPRFPGAVLATTNCVLDPTPEYSANLFTTGEVRLLDMRDQVVRLTL